jgi:hypothetical protein
MCLSFSRLQEVKTDGDGIDTPQATDSEATDLQSLHSISCDPNHKALMLQLESLAHESALPTMTSADSSPPLDFAHDVEQQLEHTPELCPANMPGEPATTEGQASTDEPEEKQSTTGQPEEKRGHLLWRVVKAIVCSWW